MDSSERSFPFTQSDDSQSSPRFDKGAIVEHVHNESKLQSFLVVKAHDEGIPGSTEVKSSGFRIRNPEEIQGIRFDDDDDDDDDNVDIGDENDEEDEGTNDDDDNDEIEDENDEEGEANNDEDEYQEEGKGKAVIFLKSIGDNERILEDGKGGLDSHLPIRTDTDDKKPHGGDIGDSSSDEDFGGSGLVPTQPSVGNTEGSPFIGMRIRDVDVEKSYSCHPLPQNEARKDDMASASDKENKEVDVTSKDSLAPTDTPKPMALESAPPELPSKEEGDTKPGSTQQPPSKAEPTEVGNPATQESQQKFPVGHYVSDDEVGHNGCFSVCHYMGGTVRKAGSFSDRVFRKWWF